MENLFKVHSSWEKLNQDQRFIIDKKKVKVTSKGFFAFGLGRDRKNDVVITINNKKVIKKVFKRKYNIVIENVL